jgi:hypothetical protein
MSKVYYVEVVDGAGDVDHKVFSTLREARKCSKENGYASIYNELSRYVKDLSLRRKHLEAKDE